jgi:predicted nuclease of restriction endonuclease-like (RecB) superfamily
MPKRKLPAKRRAAEYETLLRDVSGLLEYARQSAGRTVNLLMTATYWQVGRRIVEEEQQGSSKASYGEELVARLATDLTERFGRGFSRTNVFQMRQFFLAYREKIQTPSGLLLPEKIQTPSGLFPTSASFPLSWSHYARLLTVSEQEARTYYESESLRGGWSVRELDRQIASQAYNRLRRKRSSSSLTKAARAAADMEIRDPFVLEFLDLKDEYSESNLEDALIDHLEKFLLELGNEFTFIARQKRLRIGTEWYRVDLVLFQRRLRCLVIIELKVGKFTHADAGQMNLYLNYAREHWTLPDENPPVGLILCSENDNAVAHYALDGLRNTVMAREYQLALPKEKQLAKQIEKMRHRLLE